MEKTKILITGGAGNVGGALARKLVENDNYFVVIADNLSTGSREKLPSATFKNWSFVFCDVNEYKDISEIMLSYKFDFVFHYAAVVGVKRTQENPIMVLDDIDGIKNVLKLAKNTSVTRVFFSSSSEVYGEPVELPQHEETTPLNSRVPYAVVKNVGESFFRSFKKQYGLDFTIFRFFNTYGPNQSKDFVVARFLDLALKNEPITIYGDGSQTRTFCYVDDNVDTCIKIFEEQLEMNDVINIGGADEMTILELAQLIIRITNSKSEIVFLPPLPEGDMTRRMPDNSKMKNILNRPLISIEEGIARMMKEF
jgi:UDP-glucuronate decarboxylase